METPESSTATARIVFPGNYLGVLVAAGVVVICQKVEQNFKSTCSGSGIDDAPQNYLRYALPEMMK